MSVSWRFKRALGWMLLAVVLASVDGVAAGPALRINRAQVNVRADATVQAARIGVLRDGELVEKIGAKNEWNQIRLPDGSEGWLHADLVREIWIVAREQVRVRASGATTAATLALVVEGSELSKIRERGSWFEVELEDGRSGWIWKELIAPKEIDLRSTAVAAVVAEVVREEPTLETEPEPEDEKPLVATAVLNNPYADGLQREKDGEFERALSAFEQVLDGDPEHIKALMHAAKAHRELGQYQDGLDKLYRAAAVGEGRRDIYAALGTLYHLVEQADSSAKYRALFRGETWQPPVAVEPEDRDESIETWWIYAAVVAASFLVAILVFMAIKMRGGKDDKEKAGRTKFARALNQTRRRDIAASGGEEDELDRQIGAKREALQESAAAFVGDKAVGVATDEDALMEGLLVPLDALRRALEAQDERAQIYAELVRLQNAKIEVMERELQMKRRKKS